MGTPDCPSPKFTSFFFGDFIRCPNTRLTTCEVSHEGATTVEELQYKILFTDEKLQKRHKLHVTVGPHPLCIPKTHHRVHNSPQTRPYSELF